jgi:hypothetical protein
MGQQVAPERRQGIATTGCRYQDGNIVVQKAIGQNLIGIGVNWQNV